MKSKKRNEKYRTCADCIHEWACQAWNVGTIHEMDAGICANYEAVKDSTVYWLGYRAGQADGVYVLNKAIDLMAEYIAPVYQPVITTYYEEMKEYNGELYYIDMKDNGKLHKYNIIVQ